MNTICHERMNLLNRRKTIKAIMEQLKCGQQDAADIWAQLKSSKKDIKKGNTVSLEEIMKQFKDEGLV